MSSSPPKGLALGRIDLIICDEAHRTTGVTLVEGAGIRVHQGPSRPAHRSRQTALHDRHPAHFRRAQPHQGRRSQCHPRLNGRREHLRPGVLSPQLCRCRREGPALRLSRADLRHQRGRRRAQRTRHDGRRRQQPDLERRRQNRRQLECHFQAAERLRRLRRRSRADASRCGLCQSHLPIQARSPSHLQRDGTGIHRE